MKATIGVNGTLIVTAETEFEQTWIENCPEIITRKIETYHVGTNDWNDCIVLEFKEKDYSNKEHSD